LKALWNFEEFKAKFSKAGATQFGSGWAWLCVHKGGKLDCGTQIKIIH
jgi:Fe-Mn family superoxide dismutase